MKKLLFLFSFLVLCTPAFATTQTISALGGSWATGTTWISGSAPAAGDDVRANALSGNVVVDSNTNALNSFDLTGYVGTLSGSSNIVVRGSNSTTQPILFAGTSNTWSGLLSITTGGTSRVYNLTTGGNTLAAVTMNATSGGDLQLQDNLNMGTATLTLTNGQIHTNAKTVTCGILSSSNANTRTLDITNSTVNIGSTGTVFTTANDTGLTFTATGSTVNFTDTSSSTKTVNCGGTTNTITTHFNNVSVTGGGTGSITFNGGATNSTVVDGTLTLNSPKTVKITNGTTLTVTTALTATGTSGNLITLSSTTNATSSNFTINGTLTAADYWSIRDLSNTGSSAPAFIGANSKGALAAASTVGFYSTKTISAAGGNVNATTAFTEGIVPTSIDKVIATGASGNLVINVATASWQGLDLTNYVGTMSSTNTITIAPDSGTFPCLFAGTVTWAGVLTLGPLSGATLNLTAAGKLAVSGTTVSSPGTGTVSQQDNLSIGTTAGTLAVQTAWNTNGYSISSASLAYSGGAFNYTSSTITLSGTGNVWNNSSSGSMTATGSTISMTDTSASTKTFIGNGKTYNNISISGTGTGAVIFTGNNTFATWPQVTGGTKTLQFTPGSKTTITNGAAGFGNSTNVVTINSTTSGDPYVFSIGAVTVSADYLTLQDSWVI